MSSTGLPRVVVDVRYQQTPIEKLIHQQVVIWNRDDYGYLDSTKVWESSDIEGYPASEGWYKTHLTENGTSYLRLCNIYLHSTVNISNPAKIEFIPYPADSSRGTFDRYYAPGKRIASLPKLERKGWVHCGWVYGEATSYNGGRHISYIQSGALSSYITENYVLNQDANITATAVWRPVASWPRGSVITFRTENDYGRARMWNGASWIRCDFDQSTGNNLDDSNYYFVTSKISGDRRGTIRRDVKFNDGTSIQGVTDKSERERKLLDTSTRFQVIRSNPITSITEVAGSGEAISEHNFLVTSCGFSDHCQLLNNADGTIRSYSCLTAQGHSNVSEDRMTYTDDRYYQLKSVHDIVIPTGTKFLVYDIYDNLVNEWTYYHINNTIYRKGILWIYSNNEGHSITGAFDEINAGYVDPSFPNLKYELMCRVMKYYRNSDNTVPIWGHSTNIDMLCHRFEFQEL